VKRAAEAGLEVPHQRVDPAELWQVVGVLPAGDDGLMAAACRGEAAEGGQVIGEHYVPRGQGEPAPWVRSASELNPAAGVILACIGCPASLRETAATMGILFSDARPALPPGRSPPR